MQYRINKEGLFSELAAWNGFLGRKVYLIACGGTAMTLLGVKDSTKDIDFMVPRIKDHSYLIGLLEKLGYKPVTGSGWARGGGFVFDFYRENRIHTTELLESPLKAGNHVLIKEYSRIYLGALNYYDLIISKLFRGTSIDMDDCLALIKAKRNEVNLAKFKSRFLETAKYDVSEKKIVVNLKYFFEKLKKEGLHENQKEPLG
jgi:hypothetical protein